MTRRVPISPEVERMALDRALNNAPEPAIPGALMARIMREVPLMAQLPARDEPAMAVPAPSLSLVPPAVHAASAAVQHLHGAQGPRRFRGWMVAGAGGFGALAAGIAVVAMMGSVQQSQPLPDQADVAPLAAVNMPAAASSAAVPATSGNALPAARLAAVPVPQTRQQSNAKVVGAAPVELAPAIEPALPGSNPPEALAVATPVQQQPADSEGETTTVLPGPRGQMGPVLQQGYGYTGGPAGSIPPRAPVRMSGGPGSN